MTILEIVLVSLVGVVAAYYVGTFLFKKDTEKENRKRAAFKLAATMQALGLKKLPKFLEDYAVDDWSGMAHTLKELVELFVSGGDEAVVAEFANVFDGVLAAKLKTETGRAYIAAKLEDATLDTDVSAIKESIKAKATV